MLENRDGWKLRCKVWNSGGSVYSNVAVLSMTTAPEADSEGTLSDGKAVTDRNVRNLISEFTSTYQDGDEWASNKTYSPNKAGFGTRVVAGDKAFAYFFSDSIFGSLSVTKITNMDELRRGDVVYYNDWDEWLVVTEISGNELTVVGIDPEEYEIYTTIIDVDDLDGDSYAYTRYPDTASEDSEDNEESTVEGVFYYTGNYTIKKHTDSKKHDLIFKLYDAATGETAALTYTYASYAEAKESAADISSGYYVDGQTKLVAYAGGVDSICILNGKFTDCVDYGDISSLYVDDVTVITIDEETIFVDLTRSGIGSLDDLDTVISKNSKTWVNAYSKGYISSDELAQALEHTACVSCMFIESTPAQTVFVTDVISAYTVSYD